MKLEAVIWHKGALAHYSVVMLIGSSYQAHLLNYHGSAEQQPPSEISFEKQGRHCTGSSEDEDLMDDLWDAVQHQLNKPPHST